jgi:hypothetical protein
MNYTSEVDIFVLKTSVLSDSNVGQILQGEGWVWAIIKHCDVDSEIDKLGVRRWGGE